MRKLLFFTCLGILLVRHEASALTLTTVKLEWADTNTVFFCPGYADSPTTFAKAKEIMAKVARIDSNQTVRIVVGPKVPTHDFFRVLTLFADLGFSHVSVIYAGEHQSKEFYLRVHQFPEGANLDNENFDKVRGLFIDGDTREQMVEQQGRGYSPPAARAAQPTP